jgi:tetratricopeptide (TPR) repeat protein
MGNIKKAISLTSHTIKIKEKIIEKEKIDIAISYTNLAVLEEIQGNNHKAIIHHKTALELNKKVFGEEHDVTQNNYKNIAQLYFATGEYEKAKNYASHIVREEKINLKDIDVIEDYPITH